MTTYRGNFISSFSPQVSIFLKAVVINEGALGKDEVRVIFSNNPALRYLSGKYTITLPGQTLVVDSVDTSSALSLPVHKNSVVLHLDADAVASLNGTISLEGVFSNEVLINAVIG